MLSRIRRKSINKFKKYIFPKNAPSFMIIGAQKSGTTSLHYYLEQHPNLSGGVTKEIGYFHRDMYFGKSYDSYLQDFCGPRSKFYFESTQEYLIHPGVAENIYEKLPDVKLIVVLRDPVKRAYSAWNHYKQHFETGRYITAIKNKPRREGNLLFEMFFGSRTSFPTFRECIDIELELIEKGEGFEPALLRRGLYLQQLQTYWQYFNPEQLLILGFKDLIADTERTLNQVCSFIGITEIDWSTIDREPRNVRDYTAPISETDKQYLEDFFAEPNQALFERVGQLNW